MTFALFRIFSTLGGNYRRPYGVECLHSKDTSTNPFRGCLRRLVSLEKKFYVYKVYKQFGSRSGLTECQAYSVKPDQVPNCLLLSSPIVLVIFLLFVVVVFYFIKISRSGESRKHAIKIIAQMRNHA